jgi:predicted dehydrogenase
VPPRPADSSPVDEIGVGLLGYGFMGLAHSRAYRVVQGHMKSNVNVRMLSISGRDQSRRRELTQTLGWEQDTDDYTEQLLDPDVRVFDNCGPNALHPPATLAAIDQEKAVFCEKPLAETASESHALLQAATRAGVVHMCGYNYRFFPAIRRAYEMIAAGAIGDPVFVSSRFLLPRGARAEAPGNVGALRDLAVHHIDLSRYLVGEIVAVSAVAPTTRDGAGGVVVGVEFENGAEGVVHAAKGLGGHELTSELTIEGTSGALRFDMNRLNELEHREKGRVSVVRVVDPAEELLRTWWPVGHPLGWGDTFVLELAHFLDSVALSRDVEPHGASFADGYRCAEIVDAMDRALAAGSSREPVVYRGIAE